MISDILSDATQQIHQTMKVYPQAYQDVQDVVEKVLVVMLGLKVYLDSPPPPNERFRQLQEDIAQSLRGLDPEPIRAAVDELWYAVEKARQKLEGPGNGHGRKPT